MSGALAWLLVALGLGVVVVRRRSLAVTLVTVQALVLAVRAHDEAGAAAALAVRAVALGVLLLLVVSRTREPRPIPAGVAPMLRGGLAVATRRATLFQVLGIVLVENGLALAALELPSGSSAAIELGVAFDLTLIALVAVVFHEKIFAEFGGGDSSVLRSLRD